MRMFTKSWTRQHKTIHWKVRGFYRSIPRDFCLRVERLHYMKRN